MTDDIPALIETDARVYLKDSERFRFLDGVAGDTGPYSLGTDYILGDIVGILDELSGMISPARIVEVVMTFEPGSVKVIPTFSVYTEKDPEQS
jgi:hypothetical protein